ncbi:MAG TPA: universal stress protein [Pyrinomonadaceae bacterium]|nr:universal stress protein [Pyrinomonadaceae bacterium]
MLNIQRILCPTDLSRESDEALRYAVALARAYKAKLILLNCSKSGHENTTNGSSSSATLNAFKVALVEHLGITPLSEMNWEPVTVYNVEDPGEEIVRQAERLGIDLIVMRSRRRPHAALLLGSTAETVSRLAPCPILVTHPQEREWVGFSTGEIDLNRILIAYDFSNGAELALDYGVLLAEQYQAQLHLLYVLRNSDGLENDLAATRFNNSGSIIATSRLQRAVPKQVSLSCQVVSSVRFGKPYEQILECASENRIDLICVGTNSDKLSFQTILGSNVDRILRQAPCPILVARAVRTARASMLSSKSVSGI